MAAEAVILDLDGTLWDSAPWYQALSMARGPRTLPAGLTAARLLRAAGYTPASFARACASAHPPLPVYRGVTVALEALRAQGVRLGVATNLPRWMAEPMLAAAGLGDLLDAVVDYTATTRHKPHPDPLLESCRRLSATATASWYVGDDPGDARAAGAAQMRFAWAGWGYTTSRPAATTRTLRRPSDISRLGGAHR